MTSPRLALPLCLALAACTTTTAPPPWASVADGLSDARSPSPAPPRPTCGRSAPTTGPAAGRFTTTAAPGAGCPPARAARVWVHAFADHSLLSPAPRDHPAQRRQGLHPPAHAGLANATVFGVWGASPPTPGRWARWPAATARLALGRHRLEGGGPAADLPLDGNPTARLLQGVGRRRRPRLRGGRAAAVVLRSTGGGPLARLDSGTSETLFTVHGDARSVVVVAAPTTPSSSRVRTTGR